MKVAIVRFSSLGDVILASAVLDPLYKAGANTTFITFKPYDELFKNDYRLENVIALEKKHLSSINDIKDFAKFLKDFDYILDLHANLRSRLLSIFSGVKTLRYNKKSLYRRALTKPFLKPFALKKLQNFNVVSAYLEPLQSLGITFPKKPRPKLIFRKNLEVVKEYNYIVLGAGARYKGKMYPYFPQVAKMLIERGFEVILVGSESDKKLDTGKYPKEVKDFRGKLSLLESLRVISDAKLVISNDSAIAHMARAVSTPVLMIYGATHPAFGFYPFDYEGKYLFANLHCQPCDLHGKKECKYGNYPCFEAVQPQQVVEEALNLNLQLS